MVACSDGRLQENLDEWVHEALGITHYDRLYAPGGAGALVSSGSDFLRPDHYHRECEFLLKAHAISDIYLIFHGPGVDGPDEAICADYRSKLPGASIARHRERQNLDARELKRLNWGSAVRIHTYRCEVRTDDSIEFVAI